MESARRNILMLTGALLALGMVMVYSASFVAAERKFGDPTFFLERHGIYLLAGCMALAIGSLWDYHRLARHWKWLLALAFLLLASVLVPGIGEKINGARRWFRAGGFTLQPSEFAKPLLIVGVAAWAATRQKENRIRSFKDGFLPGALLAGGAVLLTALEPDLGTASLILCVLGAMLFVAGLRLLYALPALLVAVPVGALCAWSKLGYIQARLHDFFSGASDPLGKGYQVTQGMIAQGSGGVFGVGLGQGHSKLLFLPEAHNDFILALIGEELGLIGSVAVALCFALFVWQGWIVARKAPDLLGSLIALGVTLLVGIQAAMNIAVVTKSVPTKGISLPLISYGGSSLVFLLFAIGLLLNVAAHPAPDEAPDRLGAVKRKTGWWRIFSSAQTPAPSAN
ncbi:MAG: putative lipid II flippase FtsW [Planctomycetes bacterium]|nr:putative lipid II flippase FtsW [Planctomycetota bacterium]